MRNSFTKNKLRQIVVFVFIQSAVAWRVDADEAVEGVLGALVYIRHPHRRRFNISRSIKLRKIQIKFDIHEFAVDVLSYVALAAGVS